MIVSLDQTERELVEVPAQVSEKLQAEDIRVKNQDQVGILDLDLKADKCHCRCVYQNLVLAQESLE